MKRPEPWAKREFIGPTAAGGGLTRVAACLNSYDTMIGSKAAILVGLWAFLLAPILCGAGVLEHECDCSAASCSHEDDCAVDPCDRVVVNRDDTFLLELAAFQVAIPTLPDSMGAEPGFGARHLVPWAHLGRVHARLVHESDLPLLN